MSYYITERQLKNTLKKYLKMNTWERARNKKYEQLLEDWLDGKKKLLS